MEEHKHRWQTWWFCNEYIQSVTERVFQLQDHAKKPQHLMKFYKQIYKQVLLFKRITSPALNTLNDTVFMATFTLLFLSCGTFYFKTEATVGHILTFLSKWNINAVGAEPMNNIKYSYKQTVKHLSVKCNW